MIKQLVIERFKAFKNEHFPLTALNILAGVNGTGKSTCIQALLLLRQSFLQNTLHERGLLLRGPLLNLGTGQDVFHQFSTEETICFQLDTDSESTRWVFSAKMDSELLPFAEVASTDAGGAIFSTPLFAGGFWYLSAERISPDTSYAASYEPTDSAGPLGQHGEFTVDFLARNQLTPLASSALRHHTLPEKAVDLLGNVRAWLAEISPGVSLTPERFPALDRTALTFDYVSGSEVLSYKLRPTNVGFGLTYVLPVIVALLAAKPGDLVLIENPESHIHPRGQAQLGLLAAIAAQSGVQVVMETHSDHFLNGVRMAAKHGLITATNATILYFNRSPNVPGHSTSVIIPKLTPEGKLTEWPAGFFDQWQVALHELL